MPLYDYKCTKCGHIFEVEQKMMDELLKYCPKCKGAIKRLIGAVGIVFKGSGFHVNDYVNKKPETREQKPEKKEAKDLKSSPVVSSPAKSK